MVNFSLNSHRKLFRFFFSFILSACIFILGIDISLTVVLNKKLKDFQHLVALSGDRRISFKSAYFNFFQGLVVTGLEFDRERTPIFVARRLDIGFDLLSLMQRKVLVKNVSIKKSHLDLRQATELSSFLNEVLNKMEKTVGFLKRLILKGRIFGSVISPRRISGVMFPSSKGTC